MMSYLTYSLVALLPEAFCILCEQTTIPIFNNMTMLLSSPTFHKQTKVQNINKLKMSYCLEMVCLE